MLIIQLLTFVVLWSTLRADAEFETVCVPKEACYYVSKFKTSYEEAQEICKQKINQPTTFTEKDKVVLKPLSDTVKEKNFWMIDHHSGSAGEHHGLLGGKIKLRHFKRLGATKISHLKNDNTKQKIHKIIIGLIHTLEQMKWEELIKYDEESRRPEITEKIRLFIKLGRENDFEKIDINLLIFVGEYTIKIHSTGIRYFVLHRTTAITNKFILESIAEYIKYLLGTDWVKVAEHFGEKKKVEILGKVNSLAEHIKQKHYEKISVETLEHINELSTSLIRIQIRTLFDSETKERNAKVLISTSLKFLKFLEDLKWEELVQHFEESKKSKIIEKIRIFIKHVQNKEFTKINVGLIHFINRIITTLGNVKIRLLFNFQTQRHNEKAIEETSHKYVQFLGDLDWEKLVLHFDESDRGKIIDQIKLFISLVQKKELKKINVGLLSFINRIITKFGTLRIRDSCDCDTHEKPENVIYVKLLKFVKFLEHIKWEQHVQHFEESKRAEIIKKVRHFIELVHNGEFHKINADIRNFILTIITKLRKATGTHDQKDILIFVNIVKFLEKIKWEDHVKHFEASKRPGIIKKIRTFIQLVHNKEYDKIKGHIHKFIQKIIARLRHETGKHDEVHISKFVKVIKFLEKIKWEEHIKIFDVGKRAEILEKIKTFIQFVQKKEFDKIKGDFLHYIIEIITRLRQATGEHDEEHIVKFVKIVKVLEKIKWEEHIKHFDAGKRAEILEKVRNFILYVNKKEYHKIKSDFLRFIIEIVRRLREATGEHDDEHVSKFVEAVNFLEKIKWEEHVKIFEESKRKEILEKIRNFIQFVHNKDFGKIKTDFLHFVIEVVNRLRHTTGEHEEKYILKFVAAVKFLEKIKWEEHVKTFPDKERGEIIEKIRKFIKFVQNKEYDKIKADFLRFIIEIIAKLRKLTGEHEQEHVIKFVEAVKFLEKIKWEEHIKIFKEEKRAAILEKIKNFIKFVHNKEYSKIKSDFASFIIEITTKLREFTGEHDDVHIGIFEKAVKFLEKIKWEEHVKKFDERERPQILEKIRNFIKFVHNKEYGKIKADFLRFVVTIVKKLRTATAVHDHEKYVKFLEEIKWKEHLQHFELRKRAKIIEKIGNYIKWVHLKAFDKIKDDLSNFVHKVIVKIRKYTGKHDEVHIRKFVKIVKVLEKIKWEEHIKIFDVGKRAEILEKIKTFIQFVQKKEFDKIKGDFLHYIIEIITRLRQATGEHDEEHIVKFVKIVKVLEKIKWEEHIKYFDAGKRAEILEKVRNFILYVNKKEYHKIKSDFLRFIIEIVRRLREATGEHDDEHVSKFVEAVNFLEKIKWEEHVKIFEESKRKEILEKIRNFIQFVHNKDFGKIKTDFLHFVIEVVNRLRHTTGEHEEKYILKFVAAVKFLEKIKWEEHVKTFPDKERGEIIEKIRKFIKFVQNKEYDKIKADFLRFIIEIIAKLRKLTGEHEQEHVIKFVEAVKFLEKIKWEEHIKIFKEEKRAAILEKIKNFIKFVHNKEYSKIKSDFASFIIEITTKLREFTGEHDDVHIGIFEKAVKFLEKIKWEEHVKKFDEKKRPQILEKIRNFIKFVHNKEYGKIKGDFLQFINNVVLKIKKSVTDITTDIGLDIKAKTIKFVEFFKFFEDIKWEGLVKNFAENERAEILEKVRTFIRFVQNKQFDKVPADIYQFIIRIIEKFKKFKEHDKSDGKDDKVTKFVQFNKFLKEIKWEDLVKHFKESKRAVILANIQKFLRFVQNKEYQNIDPILLKFITEIILKFRKISEIKVVKKVFDDKDRKVITDVSVNYFNTLKQLNWEELLQFVDASTRSEVTKRIKEFWIFVEKKQFDKINAASLNSLAEIISTFQRIKIAHSTTTTTEVINKVQFNLPGNWIELIKRISGINQNLWIERISQLLKNPTAVKAEWAKELENVITLINQEDIKVKKQTTTTEVTNKVQFKLPGNWIELIKRISGINQNLWIERISQLLKNPTSVKAEWAKELENVINLINQEDIKFKKQTTTTEVTSKTQFNLPGNWIELIKRISGINQNLWIERISQLLIKKDPTAVKAEWAKELENVINLINQEDRKFKEQNALSEQSIADLKEKIKTLKESKWDTLLIYVNEGSRQNIKDEVTRIISAVENKQFGTLNTASYTWFLNAYGMFSQMTDALKKGFVYNFTTNIWVKKEVVPVKPRLIKRSIQKCILNKGTKKVHDSQTAKTSHHKHRPDFIEHNPFQVCNYIKKADGKLITKFTNCAIKQQFICKRQLN